MVKPALSDFIGNDIRNEMHTVESRVERKSPGRFEARHAFSNIETQSRADIENIEQGGHIGLESGDKARLPGSARDKPESKEYPSTLDCQRNNFDTRFEKERQARLRAEAKLRQLQIEFAVLAKRIDQAVMDHSATEYARLLALEAAELRAKECKAARAEAERKLKAEQVAAELIKCQAEADRTVWQLQEKVNVLLRKAEQKSQERLATETMASKAAAFKLQTERELAVLAEQLAYAALQEARELELKLRFEAKELARANERLAIMRQSRCLTGQHIVNVAQTRGKSGQKFNEQPSQAICDVAEEKCAR